VANYYAVGTSNTVKSHIISSFLWLY